MAVKNTKLGGTNLAFEEVVNAAALNDTFAAAINYYETIFNYSLAPIGSVVAFVQTTIPSGWVLCDGSVINDSESVYNGLNSPSLNSTNRFLRGNTTSGGTGGAETHSHSYSYYDQRSTTNSYHTRGLQAASNLPKYYNVKWIMRIK